MGRKTVRSVRTWHIVAAVLAVAALAGAAAPAAVAVAVAAKPAPARSAAEPMAASNGDAWPEFHGSPSLTGVSADPAITSANAATLGVKWMQPLGSSLASAVVAPNLALGKTLAYLGDSSGFFQAVDVATGRIVWSDDLRTAVTSTALVDGASVWIAPQGSDRVYKLNAATGATECRAITSGSQLSAPVIATPPGGVATVYFASLDYGNHSGPVTAFNESNCAKQWQWSGFLRSSPTGVWSPLSYGVDAAGVGLVILGSDNPDSEVYALDAATGALVWSYATYCPPDEDWDVGAGTDISPPGTNGFADGMAYVEGKDGIFLALDLTTGSLVWQDNFGGNSPSNPKITNTAAISTPALSGRTLVFGDSEGIRALDAVTGQQQWLLAGTGAIDSAPAIMGPQGAQVVAFGTRTGYVQVVDLATGRSLYRYKTGSFITSSPAEVDGTILVASYDGFLYAFGPGGGNGAPPTTAVSAPTPGQQLANPDGSLTVSGTAAAPGGVGSVTVQVQMNGSAGLWYDQGTGGFSSGLSTAEATLTFPGAATTAWTLQVPVPAQAAGYQVRASAVGVNGVADATAYASSANADSVAFAVGASAQAPVVTVIPARAAPGSAVELSATGFAPDEMVTFTARTANGRVMTLARTRAGGLGDTGPVAAVLPAQSAFGGGLVTATGAASGTTGSGAVYVSNDDPQVGYGPLHQGDEPDDQVIARYQGVTQKLVPGWSVSEPGPADTTPAVAQGVIYSGDRAGHLSAVAEATGQAVFTLGGLAPIEASPAVDGGVVFVGDDSGTVTAAGASTGAPVWSAAVTGQVVSLTVAGGVVYVGTSAGSLVALDESSGAPEWADALGGAVDGAAAVDSGLGVVVATTVTGMVEAVSATTGESQWTQSVTGAATGPMIDAGIVYAASTSGSLSAFDETGGSPLWTAPTGSAVTAAPILAFGDVAVGTASGRVEYFLPKAGRLVSTESQFGHPITGLTYAGSDILMTSSSGAAGLIQGEDYLLMNWQLSTSGGFATPGVIINGDVVLLAGDGTLRAFTTPGRAIT